MEELFDTWETPAPLPDMEAELKKMRKSLRRRNWKIISISLILAAAILIGTVNYGIPALENLYWNPNTISYGTLSTDLEMTFYAYCNVFNSSRTVLDIHTARTGFATYSLTLESLSYDTGKRSFGHATLEKGKLTVQDGFWDDFNARYVGNNIRDTSKDDMHVLLQLPDYIRVGCYVTFREDITMEEALALNRYLIQDIQDTRNSTNIQWLAVRHQEKAYARPCGLTLHGSYGLFDAVNTYYPYFSGTTLDASGEVLDMELRSEAERAEERFKSLLRYLHDQQQKGEGIEVPEHPTYYADALSYVEENGVNIYGCYVIASAKRLLEINEMDNVKYLWPVEAWIDI